MGYAEVFYIRQETLQERCTFVKHLPLGSLVEVEVLKLVCHRRRVERLALAFAQTYYQGSYIRSREGSCVRNDRERMVYREALLVDAGNPEVAPYGRKRQSYTERTHQHLEKRYFEPGDTLFAPADCLGGKIGLAICNDRRWPETYREHALRGTEMVMIGYNTPHHYPLAPEHDHLQCFHNHLAMQAGAYANGMWVVGVGKAGNEENCVLIGQSCIIAPTGEIVAMASTLGDELVTHDCDLDRCTEIRANIFNFQKHRRPEMYPLLSAPV